MDPHRRARLFAFLSTMHGWSVKAFGDFEEALFWRSSLRSPRTAAHRRPAQNRSPSGSKDRERNRLLVHGQ